MLQSSIESKQLDHQKLLEQCNKINLELNLTLPEREKQRQMRTLERGTREKARLTEDPGLLQLSQQKRHSLKEAIKEEHKKLHQKQGQLMQ